jgi:hypothetical protein
MVHERLPIVMNVLVRHRQFFFFLEDCTSNCMDLALASPAEYEPVSRRIQILRTNRGLAQMLPMVRTRPQVDCQSAAVHAIVYLKTPREIKGTCQ